MKKIIYGSECCNTVVLENYSYDSRGKKVYKDTFYCCNCNKKTNKEGLILTK